MMVPVSALVRIRCWCCCCCTISGAALSLADTVAVVVVAVAMTEARMAVKVRILFIFAVTSRPTTGYYQPKLWLLVYSNDESVVIVGSCRGIGADQQQHRRRSSKEERVSDFGVSLGSGTNQEINYFVCNKGSKFDWRPNGCIPLCAWARLDLYKSTGLYPNGVVKYIQLSSNGDLFIPI